MTPEQYAQALQDLLGILTAIVESNPGLGVQAGVDIVEKLIAELPPIDAKALDPAERAAIDVQVQAEEDGAFPKS